MTGHRFLVALTGRLSVPIRLMTVMLLVSSAIAAPRSTVNAGIEEDLQYVVDNTTLVGSLDELTATFPVAIPATIIEADYTINSRMTLGGEPLPDGSTVTIQIKIGDTWYPYVTDALIPASSFWITELFDPDAVAANFDVDYGGRIEIYKVSVNSSGNVEPVAANVKIESIISESGNETVLAEITLPVNIPADEAAALAWVQANTELSSVSGTIMDIMATFPESIPAVIVVEDYLIDSRMTLADPLPEGVTVSVNRDGVEVLSGITLSGSGPFWFTQLFDPDAPRAGFDAGYGGAVEEYVITLNGALPFDFETTVYIESVISKDDFVTETVLDDITLNALIPADEMAALSWLQLNTTLTGSFSSLTAAFPASIPPVIVDAPYTINSRMTLGEALPAGSTVTISLSVNGGDPIPYVQDVPIPVSPFWITDLFPGATASDFEDNYGGRSEQYSITINSGGGNANPIDTTVLIESVIANAGVETVLADITLPINVAADEAAAIALMQAEMSITGTLSALVATFPQAIPDVLTSTGYYIDSQIFLSEALPAGSKVTIIRDGVTIVNGAALNGSGPFWITDLVGVAPSPFGEVYEGAVENYQILVTGNTAPIDITVTVNSIISRDFEAADPVLVVLAEKNDLILVQDIPDLADALAWVQAKTTLIGSLDELTATFPASIPAVIVDADYKINSRMTLGGEAIPAGSTVTIWLTVNEAGPFPYATAVPIPASPFWVTDLFPGATAADFNSGYGGRVEIYAIIINSAGGNPEEINGSVKIESVISDDGFTTETVLAEITLPVDIPADEAAALAWVQANTELSSVSGTIADLKAVFPASIPPVIVTQDYLIDSRMTLADPLPEGVTVTVNRDGVEVLSNITLSGTGPFWFTELFDPDAPRAGFDAGYGGADEEYVITLNGAVAFDFDTSVYIESVISKDGYTTETVLDDITLGAEILLDETAALAYLAEHTSLMSNSGTIADLKAVFPAGIPAVIMAEDYQINSRITLTHALPEGSRITIVRDGVEEVSGLVLTGTEYWYTELLGYPLTAAAPFDSGYGGAEENYVITISDAGGQPLEFQTSVKIESIISKDGFTTNIVLADIRVDSAPPSAIVPYLRVYPDANLQIITGYDWQPDTPVTLQIGGYSDTIVSSSSGYVYFHGFDFPLEPGLVVEMTDGYTERTHTIFDLAITNLDKVLERVSGTADPGEVETYACISGVCRKVVAAVNENREWIADYLGLVNIAPGATGEARQYDNEGNFTRVIWEIPVSVTLISPAEDEHLVSSMVSFAWEEIPDVALYNFQLSLVSNFSTLLLNTTTTEPGYAYAAALTNGQVYYWRVRPYYDTTWQDWSQAGKFYAMTPPLAPAPVSPVNGAILFINTPTLIWNPVANIDHYQLQISETSNFNVVLTDINLASGITEYIPDPPLSDGLYYWRLRAIDAQGVSSPWSVYHWYTLNNAAPVLSSPAEGEVTPGTPVYSWLVKAGAKAYVFEYYDDEDPNAPVHTSPELTTTSYKPPIQPTGTYSWRVGAKDALENWSWSEMRVVTIELPVPAKAVLRSPASGLYVFTPDPLLEWNEVPYAEAYDIQYSTSYLFTESTIVAVPGGSSVTGKVITGLENKKYYWRVRAVNMVSEYTPQYGAWSSYLSFTVSTARPVLYSPGDTRTIPGTPLYRWLGKTGARAYKFEYYQELEGGIENILHTSLELTTTSYKPPTQPTGAYSWRVGAKDALENWVWSEPREVTITLPLPAKAVLSSPASGAYVFTSNPILKWNEVPYAETYELQYSTSYRFSDPTTEVVADGTIVIEKEISGLENGKYYWRVRAVNNTGEATPQYGAWSSYRSFTVNTNGPVLYSPADNAEALGTPLYRWLAKTGTRAYKFEYYQVLDEGNENIIHTSLELTATSYSPPTQEAENSYQWRVSARDAYGNWSPWSAVRRITIDYPLPVKPLPTSPLSGAFVRDTTPVLAWNAVPYGHHYQVQISTSYRFYPSTLVRVLEVEDGALDTGSLTEDDYAPLSDRRYYWRVRAVNPQDGPGAWSVYRSFTIDTINPEVPALYSPVNNAFTYDTTPSLTVRAADGARYYRYQVADASDFSSILVDSGEGAKIGTTFTVPLAIALPYREAYYWRVKSIDAALNESDWSTPRSFTVTFQRSPASGAYTIDSTPALAWYPVYGALEYELEIKDDPAYAENQGFLNYVRSTGRYTVHTVSSLAQLPQGRYLWQVRVRTASGWRETPWRALTVYATPLPAAPVLVAPANGALLSTPALTWNNTATGADKVEIWVDNSTLFTSREFQGVFEVSQTDATLPALPGGRYFWKARALNEFGVPGPWSGYRYFTVPSNP